MSRNQPDVASLATGLDERDVFLIRAIEWLTFLAETADEALVRSNAVARYFLGKSLTCPSRRCLTVQRWVRLEPRRICSRPYQRMYTTCLSKVIPIEKSMKIISSSLAFSRVTISLTMF